ncbi:MAG: hypothetical protein WCK65_07735 [Rhodospirillaceae bacterium]
MTTSIGNRGLAAALALLAFNCPTDGWALAPQSGAAAIGAASMVVAQQATDHGTDALPAANDGGGLSDATKQGIGCIAGGTAAMTYAAFAAGASEAVIIVAGGLLVPSATAPLWLGLTATLATATCSLGYAATPALLWAAEQRDNIGANLSMQAQLVTDSLMATAGHAANNIAEFYGVTVSAWLTETVADGKSHELAERPEGWR